MSETDPEAGRVQSIDERFAAQDSKIERLLSMLSGGAAKEEPAEPEDIGARVKEELDRRDKEAADKAAADREREERESIKAQLAKLAEKPPAPPRNRLKAFVSGGWVK